MIVRTVVRAIRTRRAISRVVIPSSYSMNTALRLAEAIMFMGTPAGFQLNHLWTDAVEKRFGIRSASGSQRIRVWCSLPFLQVKDTNGLIRFTRKWASPFSTDPSGEE